MPRRINITVAPEMRARITEHLQVQPGIASITLHPGAAVGSSDDVLSVDLSNDAALAVSRYLDQAGVLKDAAVTISEPTVVVSAGQERSLDEEGNEAIWEEMGALMRRESNLSANYLLLMTLSGVIAAFGLVTDTLHIVIGAMLIAPGYAPLLRISFGLLGHRYSARAGAWSTAAGYILLCIGGLVGAIAALWLHKNTVSDVPGLYWVGYWSTITATGVATSFFAGIAGGIITSSRQTVLATGVMVALALVPSMAVVGMGLGIGDFSLAMGGLARWVVEALCVLFGGGMALAVKQRLVHRRPHAKTA